MDYRDKYIGCFIGLLLGDVYGAIYEGGFLERAVWRLIGKTKGGKLRYSDDTQSSLDLANSFIKNRKIDQDHLAKSLASGYRWSRGYGKNAAWIFKKINKGKNWRDLNRALYKDGSFGNGAAMRAPIVALITKKDQNLEDNIIKCSEITHPNPLAIEGAYLVALAIKEAILGVENDQILDKLLDVAKIDKYQKSLNFTKNILTKYKDVTKSDIKKNLGNSVAAHRSSITAIYFGLKNRDKSFTNLIREVILLGGDTDTIGAMAGAIWGAINGYKKFDQKMVEIGENHNKIKEIAEEIYNIVG